MSYMINSFGAVASGVDATFALLTLVSDLTGQNYSSTAQIPFDSTVYDYGGWVSGATFVIPSGVSKVFISGQVGVANHNGSFRALEIRKNGSSLTYPLRAHGEDGGSVQIAEGVYSYLIDVSAGETYSLYFDSGSDTSVDITAASTWFSIERFL
jgi:hypothetical protein